MFDPKKIIFYIYILSTLLIHHVSKHLTNNIPKSTVHLFQESTLNLFSIAKHTLQLVFKNYKATVGGCLPFMLQVTTSTVLLLYSCTITCFSVHNTDTELSLVNENHFSCTNDASIFLLSQFLLYFHRLSMSTSCAPHELTR